MGSILRDYGGTCMKKTCRSIWLIIWRICRRVYRLLIKFDNFTRRGEMSIFVQYNPETSGSFRCRRFDFHKFIRNGLVGNKVCGPGYFLHGYLVQLQSHHFCKIYHQPRYLYQSPNKWQAPVKKLLLEAWGDWCAYFTCSDYPALCLQYDLKSIPTVQGAI